MDDIAAICADIATASVTSATFVQCYQAAYDFGNAKARKKLALVLYKITSLPVFFHRVLSSLNVEIVAVLNSNVPRLIIALDLASAARQHELSRQRRESNLIASDLTTGEGKVPAAPTARR